MLFLLIVQTVLVSGFMSYESRYQDRFPHVPVVRSEVLVQLPLCLTSLLIAYTNAPPGLRSPHRTLQSEQTLQVRWDGRGSGEQKWKCHTLESGKTIFHS